MTPAEFAARAGLSGQTVRSPIGMGDIEATDVSRPETRPITTAANSGERQA